VAFGRSWRVVGATVNRPPEQCRQNVSALAKGCMSLLGAEAPAQLGVEVFDARGPGYAKPSAEGKAAARLAAVTEGLILDPVFTAKSMAALTSLARSGLPGPTVYVHTGGVVAAVEHGV
jgi:D-cysteine desulfhydrase